MSSLSKSCENYFCFNHDPILSHICTSWSVGQITILHKSWQLSCHDMCEIVTWSDYYYSSESNMKFMKFGIWAHTLFVKWLPPGGQAETAGLENVIIANIQYTIYSTKYAFIFVSIWFGYVIDFSICFRFTSFALGWLITWYHNIYWPKSLSSCSCWTLSHNHHWFW